MLDISGFARARPIRVAFLVPEDADAHLLLDAVFANCHARWGGRYSLIVPCDARRPRAAYLPWLELFDADVVYSYIDMDDAAVAKFHERFGPSYLAHHAPNHYTRRDKRYFRPELPISCLTSLAVTPQYGRGHPPSSPQPMLIVDRLLGEPENRFVDDNFGSTQDAFGFWPLPEQLSDVARPIYLASSELRANWRSGQMPSGEFVADLPTLLTTMAQKRNTFGLAQLAADSAARFEIREPRGSAFRLVVGDSFADRIIFWNDRSRLPAYLGRSLANLIVQPALLDDGAFFTALAEFLKSRNGLQSGNDVPRVELTSTSIPLADLQAYAARLKKAGVWGAFHAHSPASIDDVPSAHALENASYILVSGRSLEALPSWREFPVSGTVTTPPALIPRMLDGVSSSQATGGSWAIDVRLQRQNNLTRFSNVRHEWRLPRRLRLHGAFLKPYTTSNFSSHQFPRATADGTLTYYMQFNAISPSIRVPNDRAALTHAILYGHDWPPFEKSNNKRPSGPYEYVETSDKGRYLLGTLGLFGGLQATGQMLLHRFWKESFDLLGAAVGADRKQDILNVLRKKFKASRLETEEEWERLASVVAAEAQRVRMPLRTVGFDQLRERFEPYLAKERLAHGEHKTENPDEWLAMATASLAGSVQKLCGRNVLYQGYEWRCHVCFHTNWNDVRSLCPVLACEVCQTATPLPVDRAWDFRLNDFLREALKEHGVLALVWCLLRLEDRARDSFYFLEPTALFAAYPQDRRTPPTNEADLICVVDGKAYLCEVKSSARSIELAPFIKVAKQLRPDVALLAVMEPMSRALSGRIDELKRELEPDGIQSELLTLNEDYLDNTAYLPSDD